MSTDDPQARSPAASGATLEAFTVALVLGYAGLGAVVYQRVGNGSYLEHLLQPTLWAAMAYLAPVGALLLLVYYRLAARTANGAKVHGFREGWRTAWRSARGGAFSNRRLAFAIVTLVAAPVFFNAFTAWKTLIPAVRPFSEDILLAHIDAWLHGGEPYRLLAWLPIGAIDRIYFFAWGEVLVITLIILAWRAETRILFAFVLTWILLGTLTAMAVSSAGPPYLLALTGRDDFAGLFAHLAQAKHRLIALQVQHNLWVVYQRGVILAGSGISAFPSMHVAVPALLCFATWRRRRSVSLLYGAFTLLILISSVALGWHYAVDGYASIVGAGLIWLAIARLPIRAAFEDHANRPEPLRAA
jgi:hypothetical protein